jgi:uncharacterized protein (DUF1778 family)
MARKDLYVRCRVDAATRDLWRKAADARARSLSEFVRDTVDVRATEILNQHMIHRAEATAARFAGLSKKPPPTRAEILAHVQTFQLPEEE